MSWENMFAHVETRWHMLAYILVNVGRGTDRVAPVFPTNTHTLDGKLPHVQA